LASTALVVTPLAMPIAAHAVLIPNVVPISSNFTVADLNHGQTATTLANELVGSGVTVSNATYTGAARAGGKFTVNDLTTLGFGNKTGIILSSGKVQTVAGDPACSRGIEGPNNCHEQWQVPAPGGAAGPDGSFNSTPFNTPGDADLNALISPRVTLDAAILEFDFVPQFSTVQFKYVFSSEEYSDFANTQFNDVFGFFVNKVNCALVPSTTQPVAVDTINNGNDQTGGDATAHNKQFFRDNVRPQPTIDIQMDGLTTVLTCGANVNAGVTNHMKLAIADASDAILDSAVFLQGGSLISGTDTTLHGSGQSGKVITVLPGAVVTDSAMVTGANATTAGGTMSYAVFSDANCTVLFASAGTKTVTNGVAQDSDPVTFLLPGTYNWVASYSGDPGSGNLASANKCGSEQVIVVESPISARGTTFSATEGQPFTASVATFTDPDTNATAADYSATIDWGDGATSAGTISGSTGNFAVSGTHTYKEEGQYHVTVTVTDIDTPSNTATVSSTANVADAALTASPACSALSSQSYNAATATFTDAASPSGTLSDFSATIAWGDGTVTAGTVTGPNGGPYTVSGSHTYAATGTFTITTTIHDVGGSMATTSCNTLGFAFAPGGGSFVIGDQNAATGASVTFWGAQWAKKNPTSGGSAPRSFKGFAEDPTTPSCGVAWTTDPGNSTPPPDGPLPTFMAVIVTSSVDKDGSEISGTTVHIVVVKTNPGYASNPGHAGTGTVVAVVC